MEISATEREDGFSIAKVFLIDWQVDEQNASTILERPVTKLRLGTAEGSQLNGATLAALGAFYGDDNHTSDVLTNFRVREFSYQPPLKELFQAAREVAPFAGIALASLVLLLFVIYLSSARQIVALRNAIAEEVQAVLPASLITPGDELRIIGAEINKIDVELKNLGSPSTTSPLEALADLSEAFPQGSEVTLNKVSISGSQMIVDGCSPRLAAMERLKSQLESSGKFDRVDGRTAQACLAGRQSGTGFTFSIGLKDKQ
jgi:hypothetical protein